MAPHRRVLILTGILAVVSQAFGLVIPWLTGSVVNDAVAGQNRERLWILVGLIVLAGTAKAAVLVARRALAGRLSLDVEYDLRTGVYRHLLSLEQKYHDDHQTGQLLSRATADVTAIRTFLGYGLIFMTQYVVLVLAVIVLLIWTSPVLALAAFVLAPVMVWASMRYSRRSYPVLRDVQQRVADVTTQAEEAIVGVRVVKAFAQESREVRPLPRSLRGRVPPAGRRDPAAGHLPAAARSRAAAGRRDRAVRGWAGRHLGRPHDRRLLHVQPLPRDAGDAAPHARHVGRPGAARRRVRQPRVRAPRRGAEDRARGPSGATAGRRGRAAVRGRPLRLRPGTAGARRHRSRPAGGSYARADRRDRLGQVDAGRAGPPAVRRAGRAGDDRRRRRARARARSPAALDRDGLAGHVPVLGVGARQHRVRAPRCQRRRGRAGGPPRAGARLRQRAPAAATTR